MNTSSGSTPNPACRSCWRDCKYNGYVALGATPSPSPQVHRPSGYISRLLGFALQLVTVRYLGMFLNDPLEVPTEVTDYVAGQLGITDWKQAPTVHPAGLSVPMFLPPPIASDANSQWFVDRCCWGL
jgi:hypothetical protein